MTLIPIPSSLISGRKIVKLKRLTMVSLAVIALYLIIQKSRDPQTLEDVRQHPEQDDVHMWTYRARFFSFFLSRDLSILPNQYIVYRCSKGIRCGGWTDRQKGIVATYIMAVMTRRKFKIILTLPCDISTYLLPVHEDWRVQEGELDGLNSSSLTLTDHAGIKQLKRLETDILEDIFHTDVTYITSNLELVRTLIKNKHYSDLLGWTKEKTLGQIYKTVWERLFKLNGRISRHLREFQSSLIPTKHLICAQIRLGTNPTIPLDNHKINSFRNVVVVWDFLKKYNQSRKYQIFIATDSEQVRNEARSLFPGVEIDVNGHVVHIERSRGDHVCEGWEKVILDQIVLTSCDLLVVSQSGLGRVAALMRTTQEYLYCFRDKQLTQCNHTSPEFAGEIW